MRTINRFPNQQDKTDNHAECAGQQRDRRHSVACFLADQKNDERHDDPNSGADQEDKVQVNLRWLRTAFALVWLKDRFECHDN